MTRDFFTQNFTKGTHKAKALFLLALFFLAKPFAAQSMPTSPSMPSISTSSNFPSINSSAMPRSNQTANTTTSTSSSSSASSTTSASTSQYVTASKLATLSSSILGTTGSAGTDLLSSMLGGTSGYTNTLNGVTTNQLLQEILTKLDSINQEAKDAAEEASNSAKNLSDSVKQDGGAQNMQIASARLTASPVMTGGAKVLRCTTNGYNILSTCRTIYSSHFTENNTFLITGDRKYIANQHTRDETFYMLFRQIEPTKFEVAVSVLQDYLNEYSFLYQLSERSPFVAEATGNLLVFKVDEPQWKFDMLIDITDLNIPPFYQDNIDVASDFVEEF